ncbi:MAG TPA: CorA family divalent cation transporter [Candidatus Obscuribacterales bacterium]
MKELSFNQGRLAFSLETFEMTPCLPDFVERRIRLFYLDEAGFRETSFTDFEDLKALWQEKPLVWLHLSGTLSEDFWKPLSKILDVGDEEIKYLRSPHRNSLFEDFPNSMFWTLHRPSVSEAFDAIETVNFLLTEKFLVTRQFSHDAAFTTVVHKLMSKGNKLQGFGVDCLAAELIGDIIGAYEEGLKMGGTKLEAIQNKIIRHPGKEELRLINRAQQVIWIILNTVWPITTILQAILRSKNPALTENGKLDMQFRLQEADSVVRLFETYRAMSYNLMDVYVSGIGLKTNETTTVLTIIATLFLPPTLIAGIYGMNFQIPEVHVQFGYYFCLAAMFAVSAGLLIWLKRKGFIDFL